MLSLAHSMRALLAGVAFVAVGEYVSLALAEDGGGGGASAGAAGGADAGSGSTGAGHGRGRGPWRRRGRRRRFVVRRDNRVTWIFRRNGSRRLGSSGSVGRSGGVGEAERFLHRRGTLSENERSRPQRIEVGARHGARRYVAGPNPPFGRHSAPCCERCPRPSPVRSTKERWSRRMDLFSCDLVA